MSRFSDLITKAAREMRGYTSSPASEAGATEERSTAESSPRRPMIRLDSNENPFGPSPLAIAAMRSAADQANVYPDDNCQTLRCRLAARHDLGAEHVLVTSGSTGMLGLLCETLLSPGLNAVTSERSFVIYSTLTAATGAQLIKTPMRDDCFDLPAILAAVDHNTRLIFLANPNNPTGTIISSAALEDFMARLPGHVVVALDEAYYEFAADFAAKRNAAYSGSLGWVRHGARVVVLRTFSKVHGLAGLRIGYGLGPPELMSYCARMRPAFSVSSLAEAAALAALEDHDHIVRAVDNNTMQSQVVSDDLSALGFQVLPTWANFLYFDVGADASHFAHWLRRERISIRPLGPWGAPTCIRVSIGTTEENQFFLQAIRKISRATLSQ
jgi:histidinol-phosphate aminotransferase